jgi:phosphoglycerate dehydrogenase-like enzyme
VKIALPELLRRELDGRLPSGVEATWYRDTSDVAAAGHGADVLVMGFIDADEIRTAIEAATGARWVSTHAAGVDHYPLDRIREKGMVLTKGSGAGAVPIAEYVVLCILSAAKSFPFFLESSARRVWPRQRPGAEELMGSRALIVGYGAIGRAVAERLRGFGVDVTGVRRTAQSEVGVLGPTEWRDRLGEFDWILLTAALTADTRRMLGTDEFRQMKPTSWIVNIARGGLIDQHALAAALHAGRPRGAYLDVTEPEPLPPDHPLWSAPNVMITGHSAGRGAIHCSVTPRCFSLTWSGSGRDRRWSTSSISRQATDSWVGASQPRREGARESYMINEMAAA